MWEICKAVLAMSAESAAKFPCVSVLQWFSVYTFSCFLGLIINGNIQQKFCLIICPTDLLSYLLGHVSLSAVFRALACTI